MFHKRGAEALDECIRNAKNETNDITLFDINEEKICDTGVKVVRGVAIGLYAFAWLVQFCTSPSSDGYFKLKQISRHNLHGSQLCCQTRRGEVEGSR